MSSELGPSPVS